ncbi:RGS domain-containing serine/threonine-protein kinase A isoform X2 [Hydra vulgaris]|uniref:RGS domain-containing serine/threonine-protein kinase A isoform X2 n=1 Tax=Hydra vulgaris TaxID=6087 RepID=UPI001F5E40AE|nr:RGS domain-containing serine/threonine-protein kinase A isoform X2 [Hydra vulgaris]
MKNIKSDAFFVDLECLVTETKNKKQNNKKGTAIFIPLTNNNQDKFKYRKLKSTIQNNQSILSNQNQTFTKSDEAKMRELYKGKFINKKDCSGNFLTEKKVYDKKNVNLSCTCLHNKLCLCNKDIKNFNCVPESDSSKEWVLPKLPKWVIQDGMSIDLNVVKPFIEMTYDKVLPADLPKKSSSNIINSQMYTSLDPDPHFEIKFNGYITEKSISNDILPPINNNNTLNNLFPCDAQKNCTQVAESNHKSFTSKDFFRQKSSFVQKSLSVKSHQGSYYKDNLVKMSTPVNINDGLKSSCVVINQKSFNLNSSCKLAEEIKLHHLNESKRTYSCSINSPVSTNFSNSTLGDSFSEDKQFYNIEKQSFNGLEQNNAFQTLSNISVQKGKQLLVHHTEPFTSVCKDFKEMSNLLFQNTNTKDISISKDCKKTIDNSDKSVIQYGTVAQDKKMQKPFSYYASQPSEDIFSKEIVEWQKGKMINRGAFGTVYLGLTNKAQLIAVKEVKMENENFKKVYWYFDGSKHCSNFYGVCFWWIFSRPHFQIVSAVAYIHKANVVHRDIKGANILITIKGIVKLIDFGCAKELSLSQDNKAMLKSIKGTPYWMAPEVIIGTGCNHKSDIWSIGCTVLEMADGKPPWSNYDPQAAMLAIAENTDDPPSLSQTYSENAISFVAACLTREMNLRPSANDLLFHPFIHESNQVL